MTESQSPDFQAGPGIPFFSFVKDAIDSETRMQVFEEQSVTQEQAEPDSAREEPMSADEIRHRNLTGREQAVMVLVALGYTAPEIGRTLSISAKTVDTYKQRINQKMSISHRSDYVSLALRLKLIG